MRGVIDLAGLLVAVVVGAALGVAAAVTQSAWLPALIGVAAFLAVLLRDGLVDFRSSR